MHMLHVYSCTMRAGTAPARACVYGFMCVYLLREITALEVMRFDVTPHHGGYTY